MRALIASLVLVATAVSADITPDVRKLMTAEEFAAAGLDTLDAAQIDALNGWLIRYTARDAPEVRFKNEAVQAEMKKADDEGIKTRIAGEFKGWSGETVFRMENGQVWIQRRPGHWFHRAESPEVLIKKNAMGFWDMRIVEADRAIGVKRLE